MTKKRDKANFEGAIAVIGLGYVGLPLAIAFGAKRKVIAFDIDEGRILELQNGKDRTLEMSSHELASKKILFTSNPEDLTDASIYIITVPSPIDLFARPDLHPLLSASRLVGSMITPGDIVIYESTVYPGCTEEDCVPVIEQESGLEFNRDFFVGYSPERINPGDKERRLSEIIKITSGSTEEVARGVDRLYKTIITAGTYKAGSIKIAEAAKVIENTQRDLNIALMNELAIIFNKLNIDTDAVLRASATKWNFMPFRPGLVGGHCIGVDPYYLTHKAQSLGYHPEVILAGRRINDGMGSYLASRLVRTMLGREIQICGSRVLVLGFTFKENCPDIRNTRVVDLVRELSSYEVIVDVCDPRADGNATLSEYGLPLLTKPQRNTYDAVVLAVAHAEFVECGADKLREYGNSKSVFFDIKSAFSLGDSDLRL